MIKKKYLVTGGSGFVGSALVRMLVKKGHFVRVLDDDSRGRVKRLNDLMHDIEFIHGDVRDREIIKKSCKGMDSICHLAAVNGTEYFYSKPDLVLDVGVKGIVNCIDVAIDEKIPEFVLMSSSEVYQTPTHIPTNETVALCVPDPLNPRYSYGGAKIISELMAINFGRKYFERVFIVRPHNVYGPDMGTEHVIPQFILRTMELIRAHKLGHTFDFQIQGTGQQTRAFIFIDDFIEAMGLVLEKGEHLGIYHIGTSDEWKILDVVKMVGQCFNVTLNILPREEPQGGTQRRCPDISKIKALGFQPKTDLRKGFEITTSWYRDHWELKS